METSEYFAIGIVAFVINLIILYNLIKSAVKSANSELLEKVKIIMRLKYLEMKKSGITDEEIKVEVDKVN